MNIIVHMIDFIYDIDEGLQFTDSDAQHLQDLLTFCKGWHKFSPFIGACLTTHIADEQNLSSLYVAAQEVLNNDGAVLKQFYVDEHSHLIIDAYYA